ncbi:MAG: hypothetical protein SAK29_04085 [Scytonema sp. PMC 1069.18]|nr:hypothetical protein [Scytonema sp. PMC 1069.18]MEC4884723.1 hypothetical protein [Scytonema sp. PMC 1070.18]
MKVKRLTIAFGVLALVAGCTTSSTKVSQEVTQVSNMETVAASSTVRVDGSSTVYPITQAIAKQFQAEQKDKVTQTKEFLTTSL